MPRFNYVAIYLDDEDKIRVELYKTSDEACFFIDKINKTQKGIRGLAFFINKMSLIEHSGILEDAIEFLEKRKNRI